MPGFQVAPAFRPSPPPHSWGGSGWGLPTFQTRIVPFLYRRLYHPRTANIRPLPVPVYDAFMLARDQILDILEQLPLWYWPVFFWDLAWFRRYMRLRIERGEWGLVGAAVSPTGRIHILWHRALDEPKAHWSDHAPRAPWARLAPGAALSALPATGLGLILDLASVIEGRVRLAAPGPDGTAYLDPG